MTMRAEEVAHAASALSRSRLSRVGETSVPAAMRALSHDRETPVGTELVFESAERESQDEPPLEVAEEFCIDDEAKASWAVRKIVEVRAHAARVRDWAAREQRRCERDEEWLLRRFAPDLEKWLRAELARRGGRRRSVPLPDGTLGLRRQPARVEVIEEPSLIVWCARHLPDAVRVRVEVEGKVGRELLRWHRQHADVARLAQYVLREPLNRHVGDSGELPDGAALRPAEDRFYVK